MLTPWNKPLDASSMAFLPSAVTSSPTTPSSATLSPRLLLIFPHQSSYWVYISKYGSFSDEPRKALKYTGTFCPSFLSFAFTLCLPFMFTIRFLRLTASSFFLCCIPSLKNHSILPHTFFSCTTLQRHVTPFHPACGSVQRCSSTALVTAFNSTVRPLFYFVPDLLQSRFLETFQNWSLFHFFKHLIPEWCRLRQNQLNFSFFYVIPWPTICWI